MKSKILSEEVYTHILNMILNLEIDSGEKIPEERIAAMLGVSRTPIREALRKLNEAGLVNLYPRRFAEVASFDEEMIRNIGLTRISLDQLAVEMVILNGSNAEFERIEETAQTCLEMAKSGDKFNAVRWDSAFHLEIAKLSKNTVLFEILNGIHLKVRFIQMKFEKKANVLHRHVALHIPIVEAIKKRDEVLAVTLAKKHLVEFYGLENHSIIKKTM